MGYRATLRLYRKHRKAQAFDIQTTRGIFGSFSVIKQTSHIYKAFTANGSAI